MGGKHFVARWKENHGSKFGVERFSGHKIYSFLQKRKDFRVLIQKNTSKKWQYNIADYNLKEEAFSGLRRKDFRVKAKSFTENAVKVEEFPGQKT